MSASSAPACVDCGGPVADRRRARCQACYIKLERAAGLESTARRDAEVVDLVDRQHVSMPDLANRLGVSRQRAYVIVRDARARLREARA